MASIASIATTGVLGDVTERFRAEWRGQTADAITLVLTAGSAFKKAEVENLLVLLDYTGTVKQ